MEAAVDKTEALLETIFSDDHKPVRKVGRSMYGTGHAVSHPSAKTPSGIVRARSPLMADGLLHLDTDPNVMRISPYPTVELVWSALDGEARAKVEHIPDVAILTRDDRVVFIDYVEVVFQRATKDFDRLVAERVRHYREELGCAYSVLDERSIRAEPRMSNLRLMWTHRSRPTEPQSLAHARQALRLASLPCSIRAVSDSADIARQGIVWDGDDRPTLIDETDLVFTAVMQLAMRGEVRLDLGLPLTLDSTIHEVGK